jgi:protein-tyrosine kinase
MSSEPRGPMESIKSEGVGEVAALVLPRATSERPRLRFDAELALRRALSPPADQTRLFIAQLRSLKRQVLDFLGPAFQQGRAPLIVVSSAVSGEGKSFLSLGLARSLATEHDLGVTLVDADIPRHALSDLFIGPPDEGLEGCLSRSLPLAAATWRTSLGSLSVVRSGAFRANTPEMLASARWDKLVAEMHAARSRSLFVADTSPLLATPESQYVARTADLLLLVIRANSTGQDAVQEALRRVTSQKNIGMILNAQPRASEHDHDFYYGRT